jgi:predicted flap endonuclease-1-like 5' DNA nuclease
MIGLALAVLVGIALTRLACGPGGVGQSRTKEAAPRETLQEAGAAAAGQARAVAAEAAERSREAVEAVTRATPAEDAAADTPPERDDGARDSDTGSQPAGLAAPRGGQADDLKQIKGIGPKLEQTLNDHGIYHFDQIAAWGPAEVAWMDGNLKGFKGRVSRDDWVEQARVLAEGGETEFSRRAGAGDND